MRAIIMALAWALSGAVFLESRDGTRIRISTVQIAPGGTYTVQMAADPFTDHFLSMRPFKCLEGPDKHWCHIPYPYQISRQAGPDLTDLEYDFLFIWKGAGDDGIDMWNGVYCVLEDTGDRLVGRLHEVDMDILAAPPADGDLRPIGTGDLEPGGPDSHWLPRLLIE
ncbi:MAG: hypothetical protein AAGE76_13490 [Pseudomonadota bacterium]